MKSIVASVGMAAIGAALIQNSNAQGVGGDGTKSWTLSAALRGFYDDNVNTSQHDEIDTFGFQISPSFSFSLPMNQTTLSLVYTFDYKYYDESPNRGSDHDDQTHTIAAQLIHSFNERTSLSLRDSFVIGQELDVTGQPYVTLQRISGDNIQNYGSARVNHQFTPLFGMEVGYLNSFYDYEDEVNYGAFLDRIEHLINVDGRWTLANHSIFLVGYSFGAGCYTSDGFLDMPANTIPSSARDYRSHYGYVGLEHTFRPDLTGSIKGGARFTEYYRSPTDESDVSPYAKASLRYNYARDCNFELGLSVDQSATSAYGNVGSDGSITTDSDTTMVYALLTHAITPNLSGNLMGQFQNNSLNGGSLDGENEQYYLFSAGLEYRINRHVSTTLSYHFDHAESDLVNRSFDRNRVFLGAVVTY